MPRHARSRLTPWIESLILGYGDHEEEGGAGSSRGGRLKAHVIGVGQMSQSQARCSEDPTGLLFLSDGVLQIPAVLTASAWEHLQEQEDRECFTSLVNTTVIIQNYRLQFHMAQEQTKCRFFLSVGELATTAAGPVKDNTPCCTALPSVRMKICKARRALLGQEASQKSQYGLDLSELLGEWRHDSQREVQKDTKEKLKAPRCQARSPQLSASTPSSSSTSCTTDLDSDRIRYKGEKRFTMNTECRNRENTDQPANAGSSAHTGVDGALPRVCKLPEVAAPSVDDADRRISMPADVKRVRDPSESSPVPQEDSSLDEDMIDEPLSNPWDMFPPPCVSPSSSDASSEATPTLLQPRLTAATSKPDSAAMVTSTQLPVHSSKESGYFPPYQKQPSTSLTTSSCSAPTSPPEPPASGKRHISTAQHYPPTLDRDRQDVVTPEALRTIREELSVSPPSWLFDTQTGSSGTEEWSSPRQTDTETVPRKIPNTHSDGRPFTYSYKVSGQNLQDFSRFRVPASLLHWAVKYLVAPKRTDILPNVS